MHSVLFFMLFLFSVSISAKEYCDDSIIQDVSRTYSSLTSYADIGTLTIETGTSFRFQTTFTKKDSFEFVFEYPEEVEHLPTKRLIAIDGTFVSETTRRDVQETTHFSSSASLLSSASGTTLGTSMVIPPLLLDLKNVWSSKLEAESIEAKKSPDSQMVCEITYNRASGSVEAYWINEQHQIVRYRRRSHYGDRDISFDITKFEQ